MSFRPLTIFSCERGAFTLLWALSLPAIVGFIGLGVEVSSWYATKDSMQSATDAAAIAAGYAVANGGNATTVATSEMIRNGYYTSGSGAITLTVNNPPASGAYSGNNSAVEVIATQPQSALFSRVLGRTSSTTIRTRGVSLYTPPANNGGGCIMALDPLSGSTININGNAHINMSGCAMVDNSTNSSAVTIDGNSNLTLQNIYTAGGIRQQGNSTVNHSDSNVTNGSQVADPFSQLPVPSSNNCNHDQFLAEHGNTTMNPGVYCNGITFNAKANVTMNPGTYIVNGGTFNIDGQATLSGKNVTIIFTNNAIVNVNGGASVTLSAPSSGTYAGILFYGDRNSQNNDNHFNGGASMSLTGAIYMPSETLDFNGGVTSGGNCTKLIAYHVTINGDTNLSPSCPSGYPGVPLPGSSNNSGIALKE